MAGPDETKTIGDNLMAASCEVEAWGVYLARLKPASDRDDGKHAHALLSAAAGALRFVAHGLRDAATWVR